MSTLPYFAALKGRVSKWNVFEEWIDNPADMAGRMIKSGALCLSFSSGSRPDADIAAPPEAKLGEEWWVARCGAVDGVHGVGRTPAEAIAAFDKAMCEP